MKKIVILTGALLLPACSMMTTAPEMAYQQTSSQSELYGLERWGLEGRIAVVSKSDVVQANINWEHSPDEDLIKLSGPLGQGAVTIQLNSTGVTIDRGGGDVKTSTNPEKFINQEVGLFVPVTSLRYWVIGVPAKSQPVATIDKGFEQAGWRNQYKTMQPVNGYVLPQNMTVTNESVKLKLFIDQWMLNDKRIK